MSSHKKSKRYDKHHWVPIDLPVMRQAADVLKELTFELTIVSAHRTPERPFEFAQKAHERGMKGLPAPAERLPAWRHGGFVTLPVIGSALAFQLYRWLGFGFVHPANAE